MIEEHGRIYMDQIRNIYPVLSEDVVKYVVDTYGIGGRLDDRGRWYMSEIYFYRLAEHFQQEAYDQIYRRDHVEVRDAWLR